MNKDLTVGKPLAVLWKFCLPLFGSIIFQQLYNLADSWVAGKFIGQNAFAAVGNSYEITLIFIAFAFGCNIACSVIVSQLFGAKEFGRMKTAVYTAMIASAVLCGILVLVGVCFCDGLLELINTPSEVFDDSKLYLDIYVFGLPFVFFYNISTGIFSALGDSKTPFFFLAASSLSNIGMDILFVKAFDMGVAGVAWATFLCQGVSCVLAVIFVIRRLRSIKADGKISFFSADLLKQFTIIAVPSILQQSSISVGNIVIQSVINRFGTDVMAGYAAAVKLNNMVTTSFVTMGNGISNYTAQNLGAAKTERIREGFRAGLKIAWTLAIPLIVLYVVFAKSLIGFFLDEPTQKALESGVDFLHIVSPFYLVVSAKMVADGILRGARRMNQFMLSTFTDLVVRVLLVFVLSATVLGATGIWCAWPIGWAVATVMSVCFYRIGPWCKKRSARVG